MAFDGQTYRVSQSCHPKIHIPACIFIPRKEMQLKSVGSRVQIPASLLDYLGPISASISFTVKEG